MILGHGSGVLNAALKHPLLRVICAQRWFSRYAPSFQRHVWDSNLGQIVCKNDFGCVYKKLAVRRCLFCDSMGTEKYAI